MEKVFNILPCLQPSRATLLDPPGERRGPRDVGSEEKENEDGIMTTGHRWIRFSLIESAYTLLPVQATPLPRGLYQSRPKGGKKFFARDKGKNDRARSAILNSAAGFLQPLSRTPRLRGLMDVPRIRSLCLASAILAASVLRYSRIRQVCSCFEG